MTLQEAESILRDTSFHDRWNPDGAIDSTATAERVRSEAEKALSAVDRALGIVRSDCGRRFFVNSCIEDARRLSVLRQREIRGILVTADEVIRIERVNRSRDGRKNEETGPSVKFEFRTPAGARRDPSAPAPKAGRAEHAPVAVKPARPKAPSEPVDVKPAQVREPAVPERIPGSRTTADPTDRSAMEAANEAWFDEKQRAAAERLRDADGRAAENRRKREEKQTDIRRRTEEREAAQRRYEARQQEHESGIAKFF